MPRSHSTQTLVETLLRLLVGEEAGIPFSPGYRGPGTKFWSLAAGLVGEDGTLAGGAGRETPPWALPPSPEVQAHYHAVSAASLAKRPSILVKSH